VLIVTVASACGSLEVPASNDPGIGTTSDPLRCTCPTLLPPAQPVPITPADGWYAHYGLSYWRDALGIVHFQGSVSSANGLDVPVTTLPVGFRPSEHRTFIALQSYPGLDVLARVQVTQEGVVTCVPIRPNSVISLDGITFLSAEQ
jgi:hypothetical protein